MDEPEIVERQTPRTIGHEQTAHEIGGGNDTLLDRFVQRTGIYGLSYLIERVLDEHYPADTFGNGSILYPSWSSEHGGADIEPGVRWVALLRHAVQEAFGDDVIQNPKQPG